MKGGKSGMTWKERDIKNGGKARHGCQMAKARFFDPMFGLVASGLWLCYTTLQN